MADVGVIGSDYLQSTGNDNALQLRIVTTPLIDKIEEFLTGTQTFYTQNTKGEMIKTNIPKGQPLCNEQGVQHLLNYCQLVMNQWTVQGNTDNERLGRWLMDNQQNLARQLTLNREAWGIDPKSRINIVYTIMFSLELFTTRTLNNEERKGYQQVFRTVETNTISDNQKENKGFSLFGKKMNGGNNNG